MWAVLMTQWPSIKTNEFTTAPKQIMQMKDCPIVCHVLQNYDICTSLQYTVYRLALSYHRFTVLAVINTRVEMGAFRDV